MKTTEDATPRPWINYEDTLGNVRIGTAEQTVSSIAKLDSLRFDNKANAALISEAVNMHDDLIRLAQDYMDLLNLIQSFDFVSAGSLQTTERQVKIAKVLMGIK